MKIKIVSLLVIISLISNACKTNVATTSDEKSTVEKQELKKIPIVQKLRENAHLPILGQIALYYQLKTNEFDTYNFENEDELTMYAYSFLWENKIPEAIELFKLIVAEFPNSSNAYDSLGEGYFKNNEMELSLVNFEKSLALNPDNFNAEDYIEHIKFPTKKQIQPLEKFHSVYSVEDYRADLDQLGTTLLKVHPNALKFISKADFWKTIEEKKALINDQTTFATFAWHCSEIIANVNCSHTNMGSFGFEGMMLPIELRFPIQTRLIANKLFLIDPLNNADKLQVKQEIEAINGVSVNEIIKDCFKHIPSQGYIETTKIHFFNKWNAAMIPYSLGFPSLYELKIKGIEKTVKLDKVAKISEPFFDTSLDFPEDKLALKFIEKGQIAYLSVTSFNYYRWNDFEVFKSFIDKSFEEIRKRKVKKLIIDVRNNPGGSQSASIHLLQYLAKQPFTYYSTVLSPGKKDKSEGEESSIPHKNNYKGKTYFLIDGVGNSTTGHFMSIVKHLKLGTIIGEELGSNQFCSAGMTTCRLKFTKLEYYVANNTHESLATSLPDEIGILPDYFVTQQIDDYFKKIDTVKEFAIKLVKNEGK